MKRFIFALAGLILSGWVVIPQSGYPCSAICLRDSAGWVVGFNHDWIVKGALIMVNKRGVTKTAAPPDDGFPVASLARWTSKYGSITFNQSGRDFPSDGMNEKGLFVAILLLEGSEWPGADSLAGISAGQWIQYQLDNAATVQEVIENTAKIGIIGGGGGPGTLDLSGFHFFACDRNGDCVTVEGIGGKLVCHTGQNLPVRALTNTPYADAVSCMEQGNPLHGDVYHSESRFIQASGMLKAAAKQVPQSATQAVFEVLKKLESHDEIGPTVWSSVYDLTRLRISFKTIGHQEVREIDFSAFDFSCGTPVWIFDILSENSGNVSGLFSDYSLEANRELIRQTWSLTPGLSDLPLSEVDRAASYPEGFVCTTKGGER